VSLTPFDRRALGIDPPPPPRVYIEDIEFLSDDEAIVSWEFWQDGEGPFMYAVVQLEFEPADPSVGYWSSYWHASGDAPQGVLDEVAEAASLRAEDRYDDERDDRAAWAYERRWGMW
jgi:hypothetical protein